MSDTFDLGAYAAGWDAAAWNTLTVENLTLDGLAATFADRADQFATLADADELTAPESAAYKAGAAYAYRQAQAAVLDVVATRPGARR